MGNVTEIDGTETTNPYLPDKQEFDRAFGEFLLNRPDFVSQKLGEFFISARNINSWEKLAPDQLDALDLFTSHIGRMLTKLGAYANLTQREVYKKGS